MGFRQRREQHKPRKKRLLKERHGIAKGGGAAGCAQSWRQLSCAYLNVLPPQWRRKEGGGSLWRT